VLKGRRHGPGRMSFKDSPVCYTGDWHHGVRHGQGTLTLNVEGSHFYKGVTLHAAVTLCTVLAVSKAGLELQVSCST
jgi:hypothetical protein